MSALVLGWALAGVGFAAAGYFYIGKRKAVNDCRKLTAVLKVILANSVVTDSAGLAAARAAQGRAAPPPPGTLN